tara:strand:- start:277 stop:558 length:282 start_codon:yes stop_codon:yes gene_type:complete
MKNFKLAKFNVNQDYGTEYCLTLFFTEKYSLLQIAFDIGEYGSWIEFPYLQISMGYGKLFSFLFSVGKIGFTFDFAGRNWRDELYYVRKDEKL